MSTESFLLKAAAEDDVDVAEPLFMIDNSKFEMVNSRYAITTICNVLMNLTVLEPQFVNDTPIFFHILKFIMNSLPTLQNSGMYVFCWIKDLFIKVISVVSLLQSLSNFM